MSFDRLRSRITPTRRDPVGVHKGGRARPGSQTLGVRLPERLERRTIQPGRRGLLAILVLGLALSVTPAAAGASPPDTETEIRAVADAFRQAIVDKDEAAFMALFLDAFTTTWVSVESDARLAAARAAGRPDGDKVLVGPDRTPLSFIRGIVASGGRHDETMENLRIASDGEIASVHFDFAYLFDGRAITTGEEAWLLVRTVDGWRIVSVVWSKRQAEPAELVDSRGPSTPSAADRAVSTSPIGEAVAGSPAGGVEHHKAAGCS